MPENRGKNRNDNSRDEVSRNRSDGSSRNREDEYDNDAFGSSSSRGGRGGSWSNRDDNTTLNSSSRSPGSRPLGDRELHERMEQGGSHASAYGDEQSASADRYRNTEGRGGDHERNRRDKYGAGGNDYSGDVEGGVDRESDRDSVRGVGRDDDRDFDRDDYYGNRSLKDNRDSGRQHRAGSRRDFDDQDDFNRGQGRGNQSARGRDNQSGMPTGKRSGSRQAGSVSDGGTDSHTDRYSGREGGSNQFSSWRNEPSDMNRGRGHGERNASFGDNAGPQRGQHAGRGPKGYRRDDKRVTEDLNEALTRDPHLDATDIEVSVSGGEVTLSGTVESREAKRHAEDIAESISGVSDVSNQIRVAKGGGNSAAKLDSNENRMNNSPADKNHDHNNFSDKIAEKDSDTTPSSKTSAHLSGNTPDAAMSHAAGTGPSGAANTSVTSNNPGGKHIPNTSGASTHKIDKGGHG